MSEAEYWTSSLVVRGEVAVEGDALPLSVERIDDVSPLSSQLGRPSKKVVPDKLYPWIFGPIRLSEDRGPSDQFPPLDSFALLDAARATHLPDLLEACELDWCSLFNGHAADELREAAPYLVRITENHKFTRRLFSDSGLPDDLWAAAPGIFLRSRRSLGELRRHFRKFTRIQMEDKRWYYFRFWEPAAIRHTTTEAGAEMYRQLWAGCRIIWRDDDKDGRANFYLK